MAVRGAGERCGNCEHEGGVRYEQCVKRLSRYWCEHWLRRLEDWEHWRETILLMVSEPGYGWAEETLAGILEWVEEHKHITDRQVNAVENIRRRVEE